MGWGAAGKEAASLRMPNKDDSVAFRPGPLVPLHTLRYGSVPWKEAFLANMTCCVRLSHLLRPSLEWSTGKIGFTQMVSSTFPSAETELKV